MKEQVKNCEKCNNILLHQKRFCSNECRISYGWGTYNKDFKNTNPDKYSEINKMRGSITMTKMKEKYGGWWGMHKVLREKDPDKYYAIQKELADRSVKINLTNKTGMYSDESVKKGHDICKEKKVGVYSPNTARLGLIGIRKNRPYIFMGVQFDSSLEKLFAEKLNSIFNFIPEEGKNCHIRIGRKEFDFLFNDIFIEYHPWDNEKTDEEYYNSRREVLDANGFSNCKLIVFKDIIDEKIKEVLA